MTILHSAIVNEEFDLVKVLVSFGADASHASIFGTEGYTILMNAIGAKEAEMLKIVLRCHVDSDATEDYSSTALSSNPGMRGDNMDKGPLRLKVDIDAVADDGSTALSLAVETDELQRVKAILRCGSNANLVLRSGSTPLFGAVLNGSLDILTALLEYGADPNAGDRPALCAALTSLNKYSAPHRIEMAGLLLLHGADVYAEKDDEGSPIEGFIGLHGGTDVYVEEDEVSPIEGFIGLHGDTDVYTKVRNKISAMDLAKEKDSPAFVELLRFFADFPSGDRLERSKALEEKEWWRQHLEEVDRRKQRHGKKWWKLGHQIYM